MNSKTLLIVISCLCVLALIAAIITNQPANPAIEANPTVEIEIKWVLTEGKYQLIPISVGDILYGEEGAVQIKVEKIKEKEGSKIIIEIARGEVLKGKDKVKEGMELYLVENPKEFITIPEASIPSIEIIKIIGG